MKDTSEFDQPYKQKESKIQVTRKIWSKLYDCGNAQISNPVNTKKKKKKKKMEIAHTGPNLCQFDKWK